MNQKLPIFIKLLESKRLITVCIVTWHPNSEIRIFTIENGQVDIFAHIPGRFWLYYGPNYLDSISKEDFNKIKKFSKFL